MWTWYVIFMTLAGLTPNKWEFERIYGETHYEKEHEIVCEVLPAGQAPRPGTFHHDVLLGFIEPDQGSGMSLRPHLWLGPNNSTRVDPPKLNDPRVPPTNDGEAGNPIIVPPDGGGTTPPPPSGSIGTCDTIGTTDQYLYDMGEYRLVTSTFTASRQRKFEIAKDEISRVVLTTNFKNLILSESYCNTSMTTSQVWNRICTGRENWRPVTDYEVDAFQRLYTDSASTTIGYVSSVNSDTINSNTKYMDQYDPSNIAGHVFHEWTHLLGFSHSGGSASCGNEGDVSYEAGSFMSQRAELLDSDYGW